MQNCFDLKTLINALYTANMESYILLFYVKNWKYLLIIVLSYLEIFKLISGKRTLLKTHDVWWFILKIINIKWLICNYCDTCFWIIGNMYT